MRDHGPGLHSFPANPRALRFTQQLMQAWPYLDVAAAAEEVAPVGICMICKEEDATRSCNQCVQKSSKIAWGDGKIHFCFICFSTYHSESQDMRKHTFGVTRASKAASLTCVICGELSTRRCKGMIVPERAKEELVKVVAECYGGGGEGGKLEQIEEDAFIEVLQKRLKLEKFFSREKIISYYYECKGKAREKRNNSEIWKRFQEHLGVVGDECDENYCGDCWDRTHRKGKMARHEWTGYMADCLVCVECETLPAEKLCKVCRDNMCNGCAKVSHMHGKKHSHGFEEIKEEIGPHEIMCVCCVKRVGGEACKFCKVNLCDSCYAFEHYKDCSVRKQMLGEGEEGEEEEDEDGEKPYHPVECSVCKKEPDVLCVQCGDVYCSVKWMGNPGCFRKTHAKGNRKLTHTLVPYTFLADTRERHAKEAEKEAAEEEKISAFREEVAKSKGDLLARLEAKAKGRQANLEVEAQKEFEQRFLEGLHEKQKKKKKKILGFLPNIFAKKGGGKKGIEKKMKNLPQIADYTDAAVADREEREREEAAEKEHKMKGRRLAAIEAEKEEARLEAEKKAGVARQEVLNKRAEAEAAKKAAGGQTMVVGAAA